MYRSISAKTGTPTSAYLKQHPILSKRYAVKIKPSLGRASSVAMKPKIGTSRTSVAHVIPTVIRSIDQWEEYYEEAEDYVDELYNAGVDTGK